MHRSIRRFQPRWLVARRAVEAASRYLAAHEHEREEEDITADEPGPIRRFLTRPGVLLVLALTAVTIAAERSLLTAAGRLGGGALVPAWSGGASDLWAQYLSGWHPVGLGTDAGSPPYVGVLAVLSTVLFGKPWLVVSILLLGSVPLAGLTAYRASRLLITESALTGRRARAAGRRIPIAAVRAWFAAVYALLPAATGAIAGGRLGTAVVLVLLPLIGLFAARVYGLPRSEGARFDARTRRKRAGRAAWTVALLLAVATAFVPLVWLIAVLTAGMVWALLDRPGPAGPPQRRHRARRAAAADAPVDGRPPAAPVPPAHRGGPAPAVRARDRRRPARTRPGRAGHARAVGARGPARGRRAGAAAAQPPGQRAGGLAARRVRAARRRADQRRDRHQGCGRGAGLARRRADLRRGGVLFAATAAVQRATEVIAGKHMVYRAGGAAVVVAALTAPLLAAGFWVVGGAGGPLGKVDPDTVPLFLHAPGGPRTLVLHREPTGQVSYTVLRDDRPRLGESEVTVGGEAEERMDDLVAGLAAGREGDDGPALTRMGVQYLLVPHPKKDPITKVLDASPELTRLSRTGTFAVWRLQATSARMLLLQDSTVTPL